MRPKKLVVLLMRDELSLSRWRFLIETRGAYKVFGTTDCVEAERHLRQNLCYAALTNIPGALGVDGLVRVRSCLCSVLLFGVGLIPADTLADRVETLETPGGAGLPERVLAELRRMTARKRGPKAKPREPEFECGPTVATLLEERDVGVVAA